jgi:hypothetical protein
MGISRQAHYKRQAHERRRSEQATTVVELVDAKRRQQPRIGTRKLHYLLKRPLGDAGIKLGRDAPDGHPKLLHLWPVKLLQAGRLDYDDSEVVTMRAAASFRR